MLTNSNSDITLKVGQAAEFKFYFKPLQVILQSLQELFQKAIAGFDCKINGQAFGAAVLHSLGWYNELAQTQGVSKLVAVAAGSYLLAWGKCATPLAIPSLYLLSTTQKGCNGL